MNKKANNLEKGLIILEKASKKFNLINDPLNNNRKKITNYLKPKKFNPDNWDTWRSGKCWVRK